MPELVLASSSPHRKALLERLGIPFECVAPEVDEAAVEQKTKDPIGVARELAQAKAEAVKKQHGKAIVIGCDQVCALDERVLDKPQTAGAAAELLQQLQGKEHMLITAVSVHKGKETEDFVDVTMLRMRALKPAEIKRYVEKDEPAGCAGGYRIEKSGLALFERIQGEDHTAVVGLPMLRLCAALRKLGVQMP
jgi:septum formation protein